MGLILFGGGGAQYSLPEQANLTLIIGGGGHQNFFRAYQKKFSGHIVGNAL